LGCPRADVGAADRSHSGAHSTWIGLDVLPCRHGAS
jgi:hypothetical protein